MQKYTQRCRSHNSLFFIENTTKHGSKIFKINDFFAVFIMKRSFGKGMETGGDTSKSLSSKTRPEGHIQEAETQIPNFSIIKQVDNARLLPRYTASKCFFFYYQHNIKLICAP